MKKFVCIALALALTVSMAACAAKEKAEPEEQIPADAGSEVVEAPAGQEEASEEPESTGMVNPMTEVGAEELEVRLNVPENAEEVHYFNYALSDGNLSEVQFKLDGKDCFARAQSTAEFEPVDISGLAYEFDEADAEVGGMAAKVYTCGEAGFISFVDIAPGIAYNVGCVGETSAEELTALAESCYTAMQGEAG